MIARRLNKTITFQEQSTSTNELGEIANTWTDALTMRASIQTISGKEQFLSNQNYSTLSHKIRVRYSELINFRQRIYFRGRIFKILAILNIFEENKELEILTEEVVS